MSNFFLWDQSGIHVCMFKAVLGCSTRYIRRGNQNFGVAAQLLGTAVQDWRGRGQWRNNNESLGVPLASTVALQNAHQADTPEFLTT